jgi:hypothetical protein
MRVPVKCITQNRENDQRNANKHGKEQTPKETDRLKVERITFRPLHGLRSWRVVNIRRLRLLKFNTMLFSVTPIPTLVIAVLTPSATETDVITQTSTITTRILL